MTKANFRCTPTSTLRYICAFLCKFSSYRTEIVGILLLIEDASLSIKIRSTDKSREKNQKYFVSLHIDHPVLQ